MKVIRNMMVETELFELGDRISFELTTGEKVQAVAVRETPNGMLFMAVDCLNTEYPMFENLDRTDITYFNSDLRHWLNNEVLATFPEEIRERMVGMRVGNTNYFDMLRIPTEREIFGDNCYGVDESRSVRRFYGMEERRNRMAWLGSESGEFEWYWLQNNHKNSASNFAHVNYGGNANYLGASCSHGVRPVFLLS